MTTDEKLDASLNLAEALNEIGRYDLAREILIESHQTAESCPQKYYQLQTLFRILADAEAQMGLNEDALKHYTMALDETDADESLESYRLARFWHHVESGDSGEAFKIDYIYDEVSWTNLACNLAQFYGASSIEKLKELNVDPEFNAITWESLSNRFFAMGLYLEAINAIKAYLDIDSTNVKYIAKLCALLNNFKLFGEALHYGEKYFKEKNYDGYILEQLCVSSIGCTNYQKTVGYFEELKKIEGYDNRHFMDIFELIIKQNEG